MLLTKCRKRRSSERLPGPDAAKRNSCTRSIRSLPPEQRPLLFAVIQGGGSLELRKRCANELLEIGFDGFGYGGWPLDTQGHLLTDIITYTRELVPPQFPMHALGIGHPTNVVDCTK